MMFCIFQAVLLMLSLVSLEALQPSQLPRRASQPNDVVPTHRREILRSWCASAALLLSTAPVAASEPTIYLTGKKPKVPGQKPPNKGDTSGTRKDPNFLRSISDCKSKCENSVGPDGLARTKEECLSDCQDICCNTYEQCTFAIVPRI